MKNQFKIPQTHLLAHVTELINSIPNCSRGADVLPFSIGGIHNLYFYRDNQGNKYSPEIMDLRLQQLETELDRLNMMLDLQPDNEELLYRAFCLEMEIREQHLLEYEIEDIKEWWLVSNDFGKYFLLLKQPILVYEGNYVWGITVE
ncbi:hypothetical protein K2F45_20410 [Sphingobacterium siyangense]|uniref:hypothetical protein n=1 Tax=Sphingobacterium TaxID=28453 RepID=UPI00200F1F18|nr:MULTISPECIES: hypothetical protein [Sphingobacterium]UQA74154.1 hypothetical protein K2F45_20410 [Sphingobacterium siyangense]